MACASIPVMDIDDITECPICTEIYTDPRVLPCIHTFCLKCIHAWFKDKPPGNEVDCPVCRKQFAIPMNGMHDLPKNFFIEKLLTMRRLAANDINEIPCDVCTLRQTRSDDVTPVTARYYCLDCQEKLCESCEDVHKSMKATRLHKILKLGEEIGRGEFLTRHPPAKCSKHDDKNVEIYCNDCKLAICMMCYIEEHNLHKCSNIATIADEFRLQMTNDIDSIANGIEVCREIMQNGIKSRIEFMEQITNVEKEICAKAQHLQSLIELGKQTLLDNLKTLTAAKLKEVDNVMLDVEGHLATMEGFQKYASEILNKGTSSDIVQAANDLHSRAKELLMLDSVVRPLDDLGQMDVTFTSTNVTAENACKAIGEITVSSRQQDATSTDEKLDAKYTTADTPTLSHVIPSKNAIFAVTTLGQQLFVVHDNATGIEVYDKTTLTLQQHLPIPELRSLPCGLVACDVNKCLYISDMVNCTIHRLELPPSGAAMKWPVARGPAGLSVTNQHHLLVTCLNANKLEEYTTQGVLARAIALQGVPRPWHSVQLPSGHFVVSQYAKQGRVVITETDGRVVRCYGLARKSVLRCPTGLALTSTGFVLAADYSNNKIVLVNPSLSYAEQLPLPIEGGFQHPFGLCLDESCGRLYVTEKTGRRLIVFDGLWNLGSDMKQ